MSSRQTFVATHTEAIGQFEAIEPINLVASIIVVEARQAMVLADIAELRHGERRAQRAGRAAARARAQRGRR